MKKQNRGNSGGGADDLFQLLKTAFGRWWKQILILVLVMVAFALAGRLTVWHAFVFSVLAGIWLAVLDRRR